MSECQYLYALVTNGKFHNVVSSLYFGVLQEALLYQRNWATLRAFCKNVVTTAALNWIK